ncbi:hypothetical protein RclHR1_14140004 [Rhizophagus clarus]|uniref:Uncharacterized protein n=1 Tax=Rhizophagus clarus TaxID=94130 RepID=A0A2Z6QBV0_9GLOM|nr:hypothetical protein RclHR1_14140004 [Rhizophagus clarus]
MWQLGLCGRNFKITIDRAIELTIAHTTLWEQITLINDKDGVPTGTNTTLWEQITFINDEMVSQCTKKYKKLIYDIHSNLETKKGAAKLLHNVLKQGSYCWKSDVKLEASDNSPLH